MLCIKGHQGSITEPASCSWQAAAAEPRGLERLLLVAAFSVSAYSGVVRTCKPFNALLGETYELACPKKGFRFLAEKVRAPLSQISSHIPCACLGAGCPSWHAQCRVQHTIELACCCQRLLRHHFPTFEPYQTVMHIARRIANRRLSPSVCPACAISSVMRARLPTEGAACC